ncbi:hypothetical protein [Rhodococcus sp. BH5]|uniref:hypothetical protein n=1 Tax=Rhodococcus sp. BH5 TaxID=2871702 RepID=UPI0022CDAB62|nr:hypothetical protein [Rhodococcus sp. BH5]MCZ9635235.1 hypothetical protein [Rhodococcus sp. BH5]
MRLSKIFRVVIYCTVIALFFISAGYTYSIWNDSDTSRDGEILAGRLVLLMGDFAWGEVYIDSYPTLRQSGDTKQSLNDFVISAGDKINITQKFGVDVVGNNLEAKMELLWSGTPHPAEIIGNYTLFNESVEVSSNVPLGTPSLVENLTEGVQEWELDIYLEYVGPPSYVSAKGVEFPQVDIGDFSIVLTQTR